MKPAYLILSFAAGTLCGAAAVVTLLKNRNEEESIETFEIEETFPLLDQQRNAKLEARIRSRLGKIVTHPKAVRVIVDRGIVTLMGSLPSKEIDLLLENLASIPGVKGINNSLHQKEFGRGKKNLQGYLQSFEG